MVRLALKNIREAMDADAQMRRNVTRAIENPFDYAMPVHSQFGGNMVQLTYEMKVQVADA